VGTYEFFYCFDILSTIYLGIYIITEKVYNYYVCICDNRRAIQKRGVIETMNERSELRKKLGGLTSNEALIPMIIVFAIIHVMIITSFLSSNILSQQLADLQRSYSDYLSEANSIIGGASMMSETCTNFVLAPLNEDGKINIGPLEAFAGEYPSERRGHIIAEKFKDYNISDDVKELVYAACRNADNILEAHLHALALIDSVYEFPDDPAVQALPLPDLTEEEKHMPSEARLGKARSLVFGGTYAVEKSNLSANSNLATSAIRSELVQHVIKYNEEIGKTKSRMWAFSILAVVLIICLFVGIYFMFVKPIKMATRKIATDEPIAANKGVREVRIMSYAYNNLLARRNALDGILRSAASTDSLTGLANRYAFERYSLDASESEGPLGVGFFDVNFLKEVNDKQGHAAGDKLLRDSAECIIETFGNDESSNCFRIGGDEFVAIMPRVETKAEMDAMAERFVTLQQEKNISIAWGLAYTDDISKTSIKDLLETADQELYQRKHQMHGARA